MCSVVLLHFVNDVYSILYKNGFSIFKKIIVDRLSLP